MARIKKDSKSLNCNIDKEVFNLLEEYCNEVGQTKTLAVERILKQFLTEFYNNKSVEMGRRNEND